MNTLLSGLWRQAEGARFVWYGADWPSFQAKAAELAGQGYAMTSMDLAEMGGASWAGVWKAGAEVQELASLPSWEALLARNQQAAASGLRLVRLRSHRGTPQKRWAGLWSAGPDASTVSGPLPWNAFWSAWLANHAAGRRMIDFDTCPDSGGRLWTGVWQPGSGDQYFWMGASWAGFSAKNDELRQEGFGLSGIRSYTEGSNRLWAGFWRTGETPTFCTADQTETQFWAEWHRQAQQGRRIWTLHGWPDAGAAQAAWSGRIRMHVKVLAEPEIPVSVMLERMREVYGPGGFQVEVASVESLTDPDLIDVDVGGCVMSGITGEQIQLYAERRNAGPTDVVVYFVRSTLPPYNGCAAHPPASPAAVIASYATEWTLAHEVGHVLGLYHVSDPHRLMTGLGTANIVDPPPDLIQAEIDTISSSAYVIRS
jgi:hypothetical protein